MEKLLSVLFVVAMVGCAESDNTPIKPKDAGKDAISTADSGSIIPGDDSGGGDDTSIIPTEDTGGGGSCTPAVGTGSTCGTFPQCGCSAGENCDIIQTDGKAECQSAGSAGLNEPCSALGDCVKGASCIGGLCRPFCGGDSDCGGGKCVNATYTPTGSSTPVDVPGFQICFTSCDPISPSSKCGSQNCTLLDDGTATCVGAGSAKGTGACTADPNACAPGYVCLSSGDCLHWCRVGMSGDCVSSGGTCTSFSTKVYLGSVEYGVCAP